MVQKLTGLQHEQIGTTQEKLKAISYVMICLNFDILTLRMFGTKRDLLKGSIKKNLSPAKIITKNIFDL